MLLAVAVVQWEVEMPAGAGMRVTGGTVAPRTGLN